MNFLNFGKKKKVEEPEPKLLSPRSSSGRSLSVITTKPNSSPGIQNSKTNKLSSPVENSTRKRSATTMNPVEPTSEDFLKNEESIPNISQEGKDFRSFMKEDVPDDPFTIETKKIIPVYPLPSENKLVEHRIKLFYKLEGQNWNKQIKISLATKLSDFEKKVCTWMKVYLPNTTLTERDLIIKARGFNEYIFGYEINLMDFEYIRYCIDEEKIIELTVEEAVNLEIRSIHDLKPYSGSKDKNYGYNIISYESEDISGFSKGQEVISAWEFTKKPLRVFIKSLIVPESHEFGSEFYFYCGVRLCYGNTLICPQQLTPLMNYSDSFGEWNCSILFEEYVISDLPLESHLLFYVKAISKEVMEKYQKIENSSEEDKNKLIDLNVGYSRIPIFNHKKELINGIQTLSLWPGFPANNELIHFVQNSFEPNSLELHVEFDYNLLPVVYPDGKRDLKNPRIPSKYLNYVINQDCLIEMSEKDRLLIWNYRDHCKNIPKALPKVLRSVNWTDYSNVNEMYKYLKMWKTFEDPQLALELLDTEFQDSNVREYGTRLLKEVSDIDLSNMMLQLIEICKYEAFHYSPFISFLLKRAIKSPHCVGVRMYWSLKSQLHDLRFRERFQLIIEEYLRSCDKEHKFELEKQSTVIDELLKIATTISNQPKNTKPQDLTNVLKKLLKNLKLPSTFSTPLDIKIQCSGIIIDDCKVMKSKKRPLKLSFQNSDPQGDPLVIFFKAGDDLRQDELTLQMLRIMDSLWKKHGYDFHINPYGCVSTSKNVGMIHCVSNSITIASLSSDISEATAKETILNWIKKTGKTEEFLATAVDNFKLSCAGYLVATHVLGIGDRHNDNIMIKGNGDLFHIDFGHFLGHRKKFVGVERENTPFVFTKAYAHVLGGPGSVKYNELQELTGKAFNILRNNSNLLIILFKLMMHCGLPELTKNKDIEWIREKLVLDMTEKEAAEHFCGLFIESMKNTRQTIMDAVHYWKHHT